MLAPLLPEGKKPGRPLAWSRRRLVDGIRHEATVLVADRNERL
ncbi:hypothetical protein SAMN06297387_10861 [Streptomyces zhaozhouensis]|uniref:Uncharacterized protein n=1 Tax=Streptomyces zhaozhouensis TaxID=1300267 RepID=A0A286DW61_9ACTN|nr:hypothetical protein SAMN06297387_10861 [Streptomyces zhaozhouensis]